MDPVFYFASLIITGVSSGTASGLFGVGGGFLMTPVQDRLYIQGGIDSTLATRLAFGTSLAVMIPTMISAAFAHHKHGAVNWQAAVPMGCAAVVGGLAGGTLASHLPGVRTPRHLCFSDYRDRNQDGLAYPCLRFLRTPRIDNYLCCDWVSDWYRVGSGRYWRGRPSRSGARNSSRLPHAHRGRHFLRPA